MKGEVPPKVLETIDEDTDAIMNNIADPELDAFFKIWYGCWSCPVRENL